MSAPPPETARLQRMQQRTVVARRHDTPQGSCLSADLGAIMINAALRALATPGGVRRTGDITATRGLGTLFLAGELRTGNQPRRPKRSAFSRNGAAAQYRPEPPASGLKEAARKSASFCCSRSILAFMMATRVTTEASERPTFLAIARQVSPVARSSRSCRSCSLVQRRFMHWMIVSRALNEKHEVGSCPENHRLVAIPMASREPPTDGSKAHKHQNNS